MSDSHADREIVAEIKAKYQDSASAIFHCGDSELKSSDPIWQGITVVAGNCDYDAGYQDTQLKEVEGKKVLLTHGHLYFVGYGLDRYSYLAEEKGADIALFGHIHQPVAQKIKGILYLNSGSISQPRGQYNIKMYALISLNSDGTYHVSYRDRQHQAIPDLQFDL